MQNKLFFWVENYFFNPSLVQRALSYIFLPLTAVYCLVVLYKRKQSAAEDLTIPIISIGNLIIGGSGKTPFTIALSKHLEKPAVVLRGYKRKSKGILVVSDKGTIMTDVSQSGDEAMLLAQAIPHALIIVCEDRKAAIAKAREMGAEVVLLDDGFSKAKIKKFDILIKPVPEPKNSFCIPSGPYREPKSCYQNADLVIEEHRDFKRTVTVKNQTRRMVLVTAISKPERLDPFLPEVIEKVYYPDHYHFTQKELQEIIRKHQADSILTTEKDAVKMQGFTIHLSLLKLNLAIEQEVIDRINHFLDDFDKIASL